MTNQHSKQGVNLILGDCLEKMKEMPDNSVDSIVTDPPYGLSFMGKKWDYDVPSKEIWQEALRVLKPGGHLLAFAGTRTQHRMAVNIEDAGFEIRDMIAWVYGSGFPKSLNIGKSVDRLQGNEREAVKHHTQSKTNPDIHAGGSVHITMPNNWEVTKGTSEWEGWGTALKPALEPITLARKPLSEKNIALNCLKWGVGGMNIDGSRVEYTDGTTPEQILGKYTGSNVGKDSPTNHFGVKEIMSTNTESTLQGRFPANLIHDGSEEVVGLFPQSKSTGGKSGHTGAYSGGYKEEYYGDKSPGIGDSGSAARFFYCAKASKSERNRGLDSTAIVSVKYREWDDTRETQEEKEVKLLVATDTLQKKVTGVSGIETRSDTEWSMFLFGKNTTEKSLKDIKPTTLTGTSSTTTSLILSYLTHLLTKEYIADVRLETENGGSRVESVEKCNTLITTMNEKMASALGVKSVQSGTQLKISVEDGSNFHSTVKPVKLMQYLVRLITPPGGVVLDPFMGSGTTGVACKNLNRSFIGIELDPEYFEIAKSRIENTPERLL